MKKLLVSILWIVPILGIFTVNADEYPSEMVDAYHRAYENWIISESSIEDANLYDALSNLSIKKILLNYANYLWLDSNSATTLFWDLFNDEDSNTNRAIFGTALSRILWWNKYDGWTPYYKNHLEALKAAGIMNQIDNPEDRVEIKWYVLITLKNTVTNNWKCEWMEKAKVSHTIDNDTVTLKWNAIEWNNVEISIYDPETEAYKTLWTVKISDEKFSYKMERQWEQNFKLSNECNEYYYKVDVKITTKCEWMDSAKVSHTVDNDTITLKWNAIEWNNVEVSIYNPNSEIYENLWTVKMNSKGFTYKIKWYWEQIFLLTNGCDEYIYKANVESKLNQDDKKVSEQENEKTSDETKTTEKVETVEEVKKTENVETTWESIINESQNNIIIPSKSNNDNANNNDILQNWYSREMNDAYQFAHDNWITTINNIGMANMDWWLTRIAMAKMLSQYAINVLGKIPYTSKWTPIFNDVTDKQNSDYNNAVTLSYQLWIMWQWITKFRPNDEVTRAEFTTALSRMLYNTEDGKWNTKYYEPHITKLYNKWIISNTNPNMKEKRWYVMIMLMRSVK